MPESLTKIREPQQLKTAFEHKFFLLFIFLLGFLVFYPYAENSTAGYFVFRLLAVIITVLSVYAVSFHRTLVIIALALAIPDLIRRTEILQLDTSVFSILTTCLTFFFDAFIIVVIFRRVFVHGRANSETIFGALCIYLIVGFSFSSIYGLLALVQKHAFYLSAESNLRSVPNRFDFIYYSFGTMTSLGTPGITAVSDQARSISVMEAMLGLLYIAVLIARLMEGYHANSSRD